MAVNIDPEGEEGQVDGRFVKHIDCIALWPVGPKDYKM
jgi:hypothetical protein